MLQYALMQWEKTRPFECLPISQGHGPAAPYPQRVKTFWDAWCHPRSFQSVWFTWWDLDVISVTLKVKFCGIRRCPVGKNRNIQMWLFSISYRYTKSARFYVQASDRRRFQIMMRVPVFPNGSELIASTSSCSSFSVLKGEYCRMSCRLALSFSFT